MNYYLVKNDLQGILLLTTSRVSALVYKEQLAAEVSLVRLYEDIKNVKSVGWILPEWSYHLEGDKKGYGSEKYYLDGKHNTRISLVNLHTVQYMYDRLITLTLGGEETVVKFEHEEAGVFEFEVILDNNFEEVEKIVSCQR